MAGIQPFETDDYAFIMQPSFSVKWLSLAMLLPYLNAEL
jgi:hypothetical protein